MNSKQIQFNLQAVATLLLAGLILALTAGPAQIGTDVSGPTVQPAQMVQGCAYSPQPGYAGLSADVVCLELPSSAAWPPPPPAAQLRAVRGGVAGGVVGSKR